MYPYPDTAAEFPGVGVAEMQQDPLHDEENDNDENKEAMASEQNCNVSKIPMRNGTNKNRSLSIHIAFHAQSVYTFILCPNHAHRSSLCGQYYQINLYSQDWCQ